MPDCGIIADRNRKPATADLAAGVSRAFSHASIELIDPEAGRPISTRCQAPLVLGRCRLDPIQLSGEEEDPESIWLYQEDEPPVLAATETALAFWEPVRRRVLLVRAEDLPAALPYLAAPEWWRQAMGEGWQAEPAALQVASAAWWQANAAVHLPVPYMIRPDAPQDFDAIAAPLEIPNKASAMDNPDWESLLILNTSQAPRAILANAITALKYAAPWRDVLAFDEFAQKTVIRRRPPWVDADWQPRPWGPRDDVRTAEWLQHVGIQVKTDIAAQAVDVVAGEMPFHPIRDYLDGLHWDKRARLETWLIDYLGAADTPYCRAVAKRWMLSAVARVYHPGAKADCALILEGPQGIKKSTALRAIAGPDWFTDELAEIGSKDAALQTAGAWIIEIAELDAMNRSEASKIKAFMSRTHDRFRPPYGRRVIDQPRQCVFAGTVNPEGAGFLKDATGGRRFWPVACGTIDIDGLEEARDQLWAEARWRYMRRERWWLDTPELEDAAKTEQEARYQADPWEEHVRQHLLGRSSVAQHEIFEDVLGLRREQVQRSHQMRLAGILTRMGWDRRRSSEPGRPWRYYAPDGPTVPTEGEDVGTEDGPLF